MKCIDGRRGPEPLLPLAHGARSAADFIGDLRRAAPSRARQHDSSALHEAVLNRGAARHLLQLRADGGGDDERERWWAGVAHALKIAGNPGAVDPGADFGSAVLGVASFSKVVHIPPATSMRGGSGPPLVGRRDGPPIGGLLPERRPSGT